MYIVFNNGRRSFEGNGNEINENKIISVTNNENVKTYWNAMFVVCLLLCYKERRKGVSDEIS